MFVMFLATPLEIVQYKKSANRKKLQHAKSATGEECKTKTLQRVKVQHEIVQYIKCNMKRLMHKKVPHRNGAVWKKCNMKTVQHEESATWKNINCVEWNTEKAHKNSAREGANG